MNKIRLKIDKATWQLLTGLILQFPDQSDDKYHKAIHSTLLKQIYIKLHNKLHSLNKLNNLSLTYAEAAVLVIFLNKFDDCNAEIINIIGIIDQKLT